MSALDKSIGTTMHGLFVTHGPSAAHSAAEGPAAQGLTLSVRVIGLASRGQSATADTCRALTNATLDKL